jgi:hypothetical protein
VLLLQVIAMMTIRVHQTQKMTNTMAMMTTTMMMMM